MKPSIGRIVHYVKRKPENLGEGLVHLPAVVTAVWSDECINVQVFTDGSNSEGSDYYHVSIRWVTSVNLDETATKPHSWHWPEQV